MDKCSSRDGVLKLVRYKWLRFIFHQLYPYTLPPFFLFALRKLWRFQLRSVANFRFISRPQRRRFNCTCHDLLSFPFWKGNLGWYGFNRIVTIIFFHLNNNWRVVDDLDRLRILLYTWTAAILFIFFFVFHRVNFSLPILPSLHATHFLLNI